MSPIVRVREKALLIKKLTLWFRLLSDARDRCSAEGLRQSDWLRSEPWGHFAEKGKRFLLLRDLPADIGNRPQSTLCAATL